jgi:hypothetical protein
VKLTPAETILWLSVYSAEHQYSGKVAKAAHAATWAVQSTRDAIASGVSPSRGEDRVSLREADLFLMRQVFGVQDGGDGAGRE